ncbi:uncharacterized protein LOC127244976 [Andrographis paniculata]|uniref:uncharacterized protein LOC127244976 n=1 Tax=Andrographis paniculata TaxID=175694 RepID=UPI0021E7FC42|nr:uncharacterized protein LOC127244976 [Andrographis paniculata]
MTSVCSLGVGPVVCGARTIPRTRKESFTGSNRNVVISNKKQPPSGNGGALGNIAEVAGKDLTFLKTGLSKGWAWANKAFHIPQVSKAAEDLLWLRSIEDPQASSFQFPSWPQPYYPELSGVDLFLADLKALEVYFGYYYYLSKMWTKPLPETYDAEKVTEYFTLRPQVVAFRLLEVFTAFVSATIKFQISRISPAADSNAHENNSNYNFGIVLKDTMLNLGPTFVKVGQSLATRPDIIGYDVSKALSELHDQIPPFPRAEAMKIIEEELGCPVNTVFKNTSDEPVAAASFGQVYKATTHDGLDVAVKVQRPNLHHVVVRDIYILRIGLGLLQKIAKRKNDIRLYADELGKGFIGELDYNLEAQNALEFMEAHSRFPFICVPKVLPHLTKKRVLTMEWMFGESPSELISASSEESKEKLLDLVNKGVEASLVQLLDTGIMHADPHPGNLRYVPHGKIGFLDFGLICRMEKRHQFAMLASIVHIVNGDWASLVHDLTEMDVIRPGTNLRRFTWDLEDALTELEFNNGVPDVKFSRILGKIWTVALKHHCRLPPYYILVLRSLASLEGLAIAADPTFKTFEAAYPYVVQKLLVDNSSATRRILYSVVFNRRREFQWQKLSVLLRVGSTRKGLLSLAPSNAQSSPGRSINAVSPEVNLANLALKLLPSKNGVVLRRLLMNADGASLIRAVVSSEASPFRQQLCRAIADILCEWMSKPLGKGLNLSETSLSTSNSEHRSILRDRRLKVIFLNSLKSARKDPILMLKFCLASFTMVIVAAALACRRMLASLSRAYLSPLSYKSNQVAMPA